MKTLLNSFFIALRQLDLLIVLIVLINFIGRTDLITNDEKAIYLPNKSNCRQTMSMLLPIDALTLFIGRTDLVADRYINAINRSTGDRQRRRPRPLSLSIA